MSATPERLPHWDMSNVYPSLESDAFEADLEKLSSDLDKLEAFVEKGGIRKLERAPEDIRSTGALLDEAIAKLNEVLLLRATLSAYAYGFHSTNSYDTVAARRVSEIEQLGVRFSRSYVRFEAWVGSLAPVLDQICDVAPSAKEHRLCLTDIADQSKYRMDTELEDLAAELLVSGGGAMWRLQGTVASQLKLPFKRDGKTEELPITVIRNLAYDPSEDVRRRAYEAELEGWHSIREPVAFALNCVKGTSNTLVKRRGLEDVLHGSLEGNRMDRETLDALLASMRGSFPTFRRYFRSKAVKLSKDRLPWWDLFAPVGDVQLKYSWSNATDYIVEQFGGFSGELADFARNAFDRNWVDAEPRDGKVGGAFCMRLPSVDESRVLANFDGSFDQMCTVAHEVGHAFHNHCQIGLPMLRKGSPMPLAETASIFCETIVLNAALESSPPEAQVATLENQLMGAAQTIVDIYSRFIFESEVVKRRAEAELSADDFCELMLDAQRQTYGDGIDQEHLHRYMWLMKPHYYSHDYNFYNFPYAFGLLFGLGVYAMYVKEGGSFVPTYKELLRSTGEGKVSDLANSYGIDVRSRAFWDDGIKVLEAQVDRYCALDR